MGSWPPGHRGLHLKVCRFLIAIGVSVLKTKVPFKITLSCKEPQKLKKPHSHSVSGLEDGF